MLNLYSFLDLSYNLRKRDVLVLDVAFHRTIAVLAGVLWAALVSRFWWPAEARRELSKSLSELSFLYCSNAMVLLDLFQSFCLNIGWLYTRLVASNSFAPEYREDYHESGVDVVARPTRLTNSIQEFMAMYIYLVFISCIIDFEVWSRELHLQIKLIELQSLLAQAQLEPRLKGPFPVELYRRILVSLQTILDKLHSMRCVTTREEWYCFSDLYLYF